MKEKEKSREGYGALYSLAIALANMGCPTDPDDFKKQHADKKDDNMSWEELQRLAKIHKYNSEFIKPAAEELREVSVPSMTRLKNGAWIVLGTISDEAVFFLDAERNKPFAVPMTQFLQIWGGEILTFKPVLTWENVRRKYNLDWFYSVILHYKRLFGEVLLASLFLQCMGVALPLFTQVVVDKVISNDGMSTLTVLGIAMAIFAVVQSILNGVRTYIMNHTSTKLDAILGTRLFRHLISLPAPYYEHRRVGDTLMRIGALGGVRNFLTGTTLTTMLDAVFSVVFVAVMFYYSVKLTLISLIVVPLFLAQTFLAMPVYQRKIEEVWRTGAARQAFLIEAVTGMQTVKALAVEPQFMKRWEKLICRFVQANFDTASFSLLINGGNSAIRTVANLVILWVGGYMVMNGEFTLGQLIAYQMISAQAINPLVQILTLWPSAQQTFLSLERLGDILNSKREPVLEASPPGLYVIKGDIEVKDVTFRYRLDLPPAVKNVSFSIKAGEKIGVVGRSGSGKSTLTSLIQKIYFPESGSIKVDGTDLREADYPWLRRQLGVVMQDNYLFDGSIRENISAGKPTASMGEVMHAAEIAGAHEFILELDEGYDTRVGERGAGLSGGQRQRIAIARALLTDPRILIFDEATSALDYEAERIVMKNIHKIAADRTMIIVAHRLTTVEHCDRIIVMDHGEIAEIGSHKELLAKGGIYAKLYNQQGVM